MRSKYDSPAEYWDRAVKIVKSKPRYNDVLPKRFIEKMKNNHGTYEEYDDTGLYRRNPLIVALGDSVTAGWFEGNTRFPKDIWDAYCSDCMAIEHVTDIENVYHEKFRLKLAEKYERTSVSVINSGISGDTVVGMNRRLERDVLRYDPDLVLVNASLNGPTELDVYEENLREIIDRIKSGTNADIVIITPNLMVKGLMKNLEKRVKIMLKIADERGTCVADVYSIWNLFEANGLELEKLLSNRINHPTKMTGDGSLTRLIVSRNRPLSHCSLPSDSCLHT